MNHLKFLALVGLIVTTCAHPIEFPDDDLLKIDLSLNPLNDDIPLADYRLSEDVWPENYDITIQPYFVAVEGKEAFTFDGTVTITFVPRVNVRNVTLQGKDLNIPQSDWRFFNDNMAPIERAAEYIHQAATHKYTFPLLDDLEFVAGTPYKIRIAYTGVLDDTMTGFYRSYYDEDTVRKWLGTTQMQSTDARRAFPCFDEPKFKATFDLKIVRPSGYQPTIGNTAVSSAPFGDELTLDTFATTPKMSTYLIAFIVQQYQSRQTDDKHFGVYARPQAQNQSEYAFTVGAQLLDRMGEWMAFPFNEIPEIQKMDMIAVPGENLVTEN